MASKLLIAAMAVRCSEAVPKIYSPNPPHCAADVAAIMVDITDFTVGILADGEMCARIHHWHRHAASPELEEEQPRQQVVSGARQWAPAWHEDRLCASGILTQIMALTGTIADALGLTFDCFGSNQGCGQSITQTSVLFMGATNNLILATDICGQPTPMKGFQCYALVWSVITKLMKASKFIDVTIDLCPGADQINGEDSLGPQPENPPTANRNSSGTPLLEASIPAGGLSNGTALSGAWAGLQMILDPEVESIAGGPVERRRLFSEEELQVPQGASTKEMLAILENARAKMEALVDPSWVLNEDGSDDFLPESWEHGEELLEELLNNLAGGEDQEVARDYATMHV